MTSRNSAAVIARIYVGHRIVQDGDVYEVIGSRKLRGKYFYIVADAHGRASSIRREAVLLGQQTGELKVIQ